MTWRGQSRRKAARRTLTSASLDRVMPDVDRPLEGHTTVDNWSLGQICNHLTRAITCTVEGFPERAPWPVRRTVGPLIPGRILTAGRFPRGFKLLRENAPRPKPSAPRRGDSPPTPGRS